MIDKCCGMWGTWRLSAIARPLEDTSTSSEPHGYLPTLTSRSRILICKTTGHGNQWCACKTAGVHWTCIDATAQLNDSCLDNWTVQGCEIFFFGWALQIERAYRAQVRPSTQGLVAHGWQLLHDQADAVYMDHHLPPRGLGLVHPQSLWGRRLGRQRLPCTDKGMFLSHQHGKRRYQCEGLVVSCIQCIQSGF